MQIIVRHNLLKRLEKVCEDLNLPVQAADNEILKLMKRGYTIEEYVNLIKQIKEEIPFIGLSTDVIVGFPSENEIKFQKTIDLLSGLKFDTVHVAAYSPREGTYAAKELADNVPTAEKKRRLETVEYVQSQIASDLNRRLMGITTEVLVDSKKRDKWQGRTRTGKLVFFSDERNWLGQLVNIKITKTSPWSLQGELEVSKEERCAKVN